MHGTVTIAKWTERDEAQLQRELDSAAFWRKSLDASLNATSLREGERARTERRRLIARVDETIARLLARKREAGDCPGHVASERDPKICGRCGTHVEAA